MGKEKGAGGEGRVDMGEQKMVKEGKGASVTELYHLHFSHTLRILGADPKPTDVQRRTAIGFERASFQVLRE